MKVSSQEELAELAKSLLDFKGFKRTRFLDDSGADGGRDIEAHTIGVDESGTSYQWKWWIELKYRAKGFLPLGNLRKKIESAGAHHAHFFLLITNVPVPVKTQEQLEQAAFEARLQFRLWDRNRLKELEAERSESKAPTELRRVELSDRLNEIAVLKRSILSHDFGVICVQGAGGVGKSALSRFLVYHLYQQYDCGLIDCRLNDDFGLAFKMLADAFRRQGAETGFAYSANLRLVETQRLEMLFEHSVERPTLLLIDNLEEVIGPQGDIKDRLIYDLVVRFIQHNVHGSVLLLTSRAKIADMVITSNVRFLPFPLSGWDIDFVLDEYLPSADHLFTRLEHLGNDRKRKEEELALFRGNPLALKIANQLCASYDLREMVELLPREVDLAQGLIEALSRELDQSEIDALTALSQLDRPVTSKEVSQFVCTEETLRNLLLRQLVEPVDSIESQFVVHPITADHFSLRDQPERRRQVVLKLVEQIRLVVDASLDGIDSVYNHFLLRQSVRMLIQVNEFDAAGELIVRIGTRAVSMGDVGYLQHMLDLIEPRLDRRIRAKLLKVRGHIYDLRGDLQRATETYEQMLNEGEDLEDPWTRASALNGLASMHRFRGELDKALSLYHESLAIREETRDLVGQSNSHHNIGAVHLELHEIESAQSHLKAAVAMRKRLKDKFRMSASQLYLGESYCEVGDFESARQCLQQCLKLKYQLDDIVGILWARLLRIKIEFLDPVGDPAQLKEDVNWCLECADRIDKTRDIMLSSAFSGVYELLVTSNEAAALQRLVRAKRLARALQNEVQYSYIDELLRQIVGSTEPGGVRKAAVGLVRKLKI